MALEYRYTGADGERLGGLRVRDRIGSKPTHLLFRPDPGHEPLDTQGARRALTESN